MNQTQEINGQTPEESPGYFDQVNDWEQDLNKDKVSPQQTRGGKNQTKYEPYSKSNRTKKN